MDNINQTKFPNHSWNLEMVMEDHILHDQIPFNSLWPSFPLQSVHQMPSSSFTQIPNSSTLFGDETGNYNNQIELEEEEPEEELGAMKEMMYKIAAMQPVDIDPATIRRPKRRNVRISDDPQSIAARHRRERISEKMRILQRLVPGGTKMDTASMLDEAIRYVKFLKREIRLLLSNQALQQPPCIGDNNWQVAAPNNNIIKPPAAGSSSLTSLDPPSGRGFSFGGEPNLCFINHEVISD